MVLLSRVAGLQMYCHCSEAAAILQGHVLSIVAVKVSTRNNLAPQIMPIVMLTLLPCCTLWYQTLLLCHMAYCLLAASVSCSQAMCI